MWTRRANKLLLLATFLSTSTCEEPCTPEFKPNFNDVVQLTYNYGNGVVNRMVVKLADGQPFVEMFTDSCRDLSKIKIRVDYRNVEDQDWTQFVGRRGTIRLDRGKLEIRKTILPCAQYEVKIVAILEDDTEIDSEILNFGPFYKVLDEDTIKEKLTEESMHDIADTITYSNISSTGFTVSWGDICAQSLNFYLLQGPSFTPDYLPYKTITNVLETNTGNSLWISTEPCQKYKVAIKSFMTKKTDYEYVESRDHNDEEAEPITTGPLPDTLIATSMEEGSNVLTWQFTDQTDCVAVINYEIDLISETGEDTNSLLAGNWEDQAAQVDISENTYSPCENYELQMKISYTTQSGNSVEKSVFRRSFRTNHLGEFAPEGTNYLAILEDTVSVIFETCDTEAVLALIDENEDSTVQEFTVTHDDVNVELEEINELMSPCVHYNVVLRGLDGNEFNSEPLEPKNPQGKVAFNQTEYSTDSLRFSVDDIEENSRCQVSDYQVTCHPQEDNQEGKNLLQEFVGKSVDGSFVEVINLAPTTTYICQAMINYTGFEDNTDVIPAEEIDFFTEGFDTIEIVDGNIVVNCTDANCTGTARLTHEIPTDKRQGLLEHLPVNKCCPRGKLLHLNTKECVDDTFKSERNASIVAKHTSDFNNILETSFDLTDPSKPFSKCVLSQRRNIKDFVLVSINGTLFAYKLRGGEIFKTFCVDRNNNDQDDTAVIQVCDECASELCLSFCCGKGSYTSDGACKKGDTSAWDEGIQNTTHKRVHSDLHCDKPIKFPENLYEIKNNQLVVDSTVRDHSEYCITNAMENGQPVSNVLLCPIDGNTDRNGRNKVKTVLLSLSEISILIVLIFHYLISGLRRSHFAKMKMAFLNCLFILFFVLIITTTIDFKEEVGDNFCIFMGLLVQYFGLATFFWLTCMSFDIWRTFRKLNDPTDNIQEQQRVRTILTRTFFLLSFLGPFFIVLITTILQTAESPENASYLHPRIGKPSCFLKDEEPAFYYFFLIIAVLLSTNLVFYALLVYAFFWGVWANNRNFNIKRDNMKICIELIMIMGLNWLTEFASFMVGWKAKEYWDHPIIWFCDILNWLTGVFILLAFITKASNQKLLKAYFGCLRRGNMSLQLDTRGIRSRAISKTSTTSQITIVSHCALTPQNSSPSIIEDPDSPNGSVKSSSVTEGSDSPTGSVKSTSVIEGSDSLTGSIKSDISESNKVTLISMESVESGVGSLDSGEAPILD